jgi:hypothetical protein
LQVCVAPPLGGSDCSDNPPLYRAIDQIVASTDSLSLILSTYDGAISSLNWSTSLRYDALKVFIEVQTTSARLRLTPARNIKPSATLPEEGSTQ